MSKKKLIIKEINFYNYPVMISSFDKINIANNNIIKKKLINLTIENWMLKFKILIKIVKAYKNKKFKIWVYRSS